MTNSIMTNFNDHIINDNFTIREALARLDKIGIHGNVLFVINNINQLIGTVSDGDIRRGLLNNLNVDSLITDTANKEFHFIKDNKNCSIQEQAKAFKLQNIKYVPIIGLNKELIQIINTEKYKHFLPVDVFIMAGGKGSRLMPLTKDCPKPMLKIGNKPILEHNIDRLIAYGISNFTISLNYLGNVIEGYFQNGQNKGVNINYVKETSPLGTIGSISLVKEFQNDYILVMNSDLLTDIDYTDFFEDFLEAKSMLSVASTPYNVNIPYAVLEMDENNHIKKITEKPKYTYYSNAGIYLIRKQALIEVPYNEFYNATDLIEAIISNGEKVSTYPILSYWLDIGKMPDYIKAQEDIKHLRI